MRMLLSKLWADDRGFIISTEMLFITVILVIGLVAGWAALQGAVLNQLTSVATAITALDASYNTPGYTTTNGVATTDSSSYQYVATAPTLVSVGGTASASIGQLTYAPVVP